MLGKDVSGKKKKVTINPPTLLFVSESVNCFNITTINNDDRLYASNYIK